MEDEESVSLVSLPDELARLVLSHCDAASLASTSAACMHLGALASDPGLWQKCHCARWRWPALSHETQGGWRADYARRHRIDKRAVALFEQLPGGGEACHTAWRELLEFGSLAMDAVQRLLPSAAAAAALVALNQTAVWEEWQALVADTTTHGQIHGVEAGALLIARFYQSAEELGAANAELEACAQLDSLAARLSARLGPLEAEQHLRPDVDVVSELAKMLFTEDGWHQPANYYDVSNSRLDRVLAARAGIPISLSVVFAAVCRRCGIELDMIGLPGHFLLATRAQPASGAGRVFVDAYHGGNLLQLDECRDIVARYGLEWSDAMVRPVPHTEAWGRMVRNLLNCHDQAGEHAQAGLVQQFLRRRHANDRMGMCDRLVVNPPRLGDEPPAQAEQDAAAGGGGGPQSPLSSLAQVFQASGQGGLAGQAGPQVTMQVEQMLQALQQALQAAGPSGAGGAEGQL